MAAPTLRAYRPGDERRIQEMFIDIFRERPLAEWTWRFKGAPAGEAFILVAEYEDKIIGHHAHVGFETFVHGRLFLLGYGGDTMVDPEHRGKGIVRLISEGFLWAAHEYDLRMGFPSDRAAELFVRYGFSKHLGRMARWVRLEALGAIPAAPRPLRLAFRMVHGAMKRVARARDRGISVIPLAELGPEIDELSERSARFAPCIRKRDASYLRWRWFEQPGPAWSMLGARDQSGRLLGWVVYGRDGRQQSRLVTGVVADLLIEDPHTTRILLAAAADRLAATGCELVELAYVDPRPWARRACMRAGFVRRGLGFNVLSKALSSRVDATVENLDNWYLTRGDTDLA